MKYSHLRGLQGHLGQAAPDHLCPVYLLVSKDGYERKTAAEVVTEAIGAEEVVVLQGESITPAKLGDELGAQSLFAKRRLIHIRRLDKVVVADVVLAYCDRPDPNTFLLIEADSLASNTRLYKGCEKAGVILDVGTLPPWEVEKVLVEWLVGEATARQKSLSRAVAQVLVQRIGNGKGALIQELEKLICYIDDRPSIEIEDVQAVGAVDRLPEMAWEVGRSVMRRDVVGAMCLVNGWLKRPDASAIGLISQVRSQIHTGFQVCTIISRGGSAHDVSTTLPQLRGRNATNMIDLARTYGLGRFQIAMRALSEADLAAKNGTPPTDILVESLITRLATC